MTLLTPLINDIREKRLWPVVAVLVVALVAVPVLLAKPASKSRPAVAAVPPAAGPSPTSAVPVVSLSSAAGQAKLHARARDPFKQQHQASSSPASTSTTATTTPSGAGAGAGGAAGSHGSSGASGTTHSSGGSGATTGPSTGTVNPGLPVPPITIPKTKPKPAPEGLSQTQSYAVTLAITKPGGGLDTFDPIERLTALPSRQMPLLLELGVLKGGHRVLFAVQPAAVLYGPGTCIPGRINCQILSLGEDQIETVGLKTATGSVPLAQFAVTAVSADRHRTPAAAQEARRQTSAFGQRVLRATHLSALSLFPYMPSVGAIVDRRNLTAGGN